VNERRFLHLPSRPWRIVVYVVLLAVMLGVNYWGAHRVTQVTRIRVPYSPFFLQQLRSGNVVSVTSTAAELQGSFAQATKPAGASTAATHFVTEIPSFAATPPLSRLLQAKHVEVNA
jgi:cell division protease FtsH